MPLVAWDSSMSVGIESIDKEHRNLFVLLNDLYSGVQKGNGKEVLAKALDGLVLCAQVHFKNEESYFQKTGYPQAAAHIAEHKRLMQQIHEVQLKFEKDPSATLTADVMAFLKNWLLDHMRESDRQYSEHLIANGIR